MLVVILTTLFSRSFGLCYHVCTPDGLLYYMEVDDDGEVIETALEEGGCTGGPSIQLIECGLSGNFDEDATASLQRLDLSKLRPPTQAERDLFSAMIKNGAVKVVVSSQKLPPAIAERLQTH